MTTIPDDPVSTPPEGEPSEDPAQDAPPDVLPEPDEDGGDLPPAT